MASAENRISDEIRLALSESCVLVRSPSGQFWAGKRVWSKEFNQYVLVNMQPVRVLRNGYPDLTGFRRSDGKFIGIEVKTATGKPRPEQENFIRVAQSSGALAGFARSVEDAKEIVKEESI